jgi:hypothetical protein
VFEKARLESADNPQGSSTEVDTYLVAKNLERFTVEIVTLRLFRSRERLTSYLLHAPQKVVKPVFKVNGKYGHVCAP